MNLPSFSEYHKIVCLTEESMTSCDGTIEGFLDSLEEAGLNVEEVMTSDIAQITEPIGMLRRRNPTIIESAPPGEKAEKFITKNKAAFKKRYGSEWESVLYATAWKIFGDKKVDEEISDDMSRWIQNNRSKFETRYGKNWYDHAYREAQKKFEPKTSVVQKVIKATDASAEKAVDAALPDAAPIVKGAASFADKVMKD